MGKIIGIDLGTSNSAAASLIGGKPVIIQAAEGASIGGKSFPSVVAFSQDGQLMVGEPARRQMLSNPEGTVIAAKRKMGTDYKFRVFGKNILHNKYLHLFFKRSRRMLKHFLVIQSIKL
jgi:molecular chaperone DnaK